MAQELTLKASGLYSHPSPLSEVPEGALVRADNVVCPAEGQVETRRGQEAIAPTANSPTSMGAFGGQLLAFGGNTLERHDGTTAAVVGSGYDPPTGYRVRFMEAAESLFFTTAFGMKRMEAVTGAIARAGLPRCLDLFDPVASAATPLWLPDDYSVGYRAVLGYRDANERLMLSAPSGLRTFTNTSGTTCSVLVSAYLPPGLSTSHFLQVYRTRARPASAGHPGDEVQLVYEDFLTSTQLTNGFVLVLDTVADEFRGAAGYFNANQEGALLANEPPPVARDVAQFAGCAFYFNTTQKHRISLRILGVGAPDGVQDGDTFSVTSTTTGATTTYTWRTAPVLSTDLMLYTTGTPSENVEATARSLATRLNQLGNGDLPCAYYVSGPDDAPGMLQLEERRVGEFAFTVSTSRASAWGERMPATSTNAANPAGLSWSKPGQPDAVPLVYNTTVGNKGSEGYRALSLRDALFLFKADGVFRLTGDSPASFSVSLLDPTVRLLAPQSVVALANQAFALTDQGVVAVTDTGVAVISRPVEGELLETLAAAGTAKVRELAFAVGYETDRSYLLWLPTTPTSTTCEVAYVYNVATGVWTRRTDAATCGFVPPHDDRLHLGGTGLGFLTRERKTRTSEDWQDGDGEAIQSEVGWTVKTGGNPGASKHYREAAPILKHPATAAEVAFSTDWAPEEEAVAWVQPGLFPLPFPIGFGTGEGLARPVRVTVPRNKGRCTQLSITLRHGVVGEQLVVMGLSLMFNPTGERGGR